MRYRIELAATAKADIHEQVKWLRDQATPAAADKWLDGLYKAIAALETRPLRRPLAAENDKFPVEIRALLHGRRKGHKHRIIFTIRGGTIEHAFGWMARFRRPARDHERLATTLEGLHYVAFRIPMLYNAAPFLAVLSS